MSFGYEFVEHFKSLSHPIECDYFNNEAESCAGQLLDNYEHWFAGRNHPCTEQELEIINNQ